MTITIDDVLLEAEEKMLKTEEVLVHEFIGVRTGKASPGLVEHIMVEAYGGQMRLKELAGITTPEARVINIQPWDGTMVHPIEKAIQKSSLGINPAIQGKVIRLFLPELSQERRLELTKMVKKMAEDSRVAVRHIRRDALESLHKHCKEHNSEDAVEKAEKEIQKLHDEFMKKIDEHLVHKDKEIMTV